MDIIESVKTAEERAERIRRDATLEGQALISSYEKKGHDDGATLVADAKKRSEEITKKATLEAEVEADKILKAQFHGTVIQKQADNQQTICP